MKTLKYAMIALLVAIGMDGILVFAYASPTSMQIGSTLSGNTAQYTQYATKKTWTGQKYYNRETYTAMTNPCPNCQIANYFQKSGGSSSGAIITKTGQTKGSNETGTASPGDYRLKYQRYDFTLLDTYHFATWTINQ